MPGEKDQFAETMIRDDSSVPSAPNVSTVVPRPGAALGQGLILAGRYEIGVLMGQGGMGTVYAARDADLDEEVALKVLRPDLARDDQFRARLRAEVRLARRVSHPNVCRVHDLGIAADDLVFVTMELVHGRTLRQLLGEIRAGRLPPFSIAQVVDLVVQIGSALAAAHRAGVIHRDVKPDNVIVTDGRAVLTDFGVATRSSDRPDTVAGTPAYLAPEVSRNEPFDAKVDVYALAVLAYELVAGHVPFAARTMEDAEVLARDRPAYPPLPEHPAFDRVLSRALAMEPALRTTTVDRFTEAFALAAREAGDALGTFASPSSSATGIPRQGDDIATAPVSTASRRDEVPTASRRDAVPTSPPTASRASSDSISTPRGSTRRPEVRIATAFAWRGDDGETVERIVVDAGGVLTRATTNEVNALFGALRSLGDDAVRAARAALDAIGRAGGQIALDTERVLLRSESESLANVPMPNPSVAGQGEVVASATVARQLAARFELEVRGDRRRIVGPLATSGGMSLASSIRSFRARELATIEGLVERAFHERTPIAIEVRAAAGMGKTRLREAIASTISAKREVEWLVAHAPLGDAPAPLSTLATASAEWLEAATGRGAIGDPARQRNAARRWLEGRATRRPIALVVEDVQWADPSTLAVLEHLRATLEDVPVAIITFARDDGPATPAGVQVVRLDPLDATAATRLVRGLAPSIASDDVDRIVALAAGNPFYLEELATSGASGAMPESIGKTGVPPMLGQAGPPLAIEAAIQAKLDRVSADAHAVAHAAAVCGRSFWYSALGHLVDAPDLDGALAELERHGLVVATAPVALDDDRYTFTGHLVRDVIYARVPPRDRRALHAAIATWLEGKTKDELALVLDAAAHREHAGDTAGAAIAYRRAGARCLAGFAYAEAAAALKRAIDLTPAPDATLLEDLGDAIAETAGPAAAESSYAKAAEIVDRIGGVVTNAAHPNAPQRARLWTKLATSAGRRGDYAMAIERYRAGLRLALVASPEPGSVSNTVIGDKLAAWAIPDPRTPAKLLGGLGWTIGYQLGRVDEGHPMCERAVALLEGTSHQRELAFVLSRLGGTYMRACRFADQLRTNQRNLEISRDLGDLNMQLTANINLGVVHQVLGAIDEAITCTLAARDLAIRTGALASRGLVASNLGGLLVETGRLGDARAALDEAEDLIARTGHRYVLPETLVFAARVAAAGGDLAAARHHAERSRALARELESPLDAAIATRILAQLASRAGDHATARALVDEALAAIEPVDAYETVRTRAARSRVLRAAGDEEGAAVAAAARADLERLGSLRELAVLDDLDEVR